MTRDDHPTVTLRVLDDQLAICRLAPTAAPPPFPAGPALFSITRTPDELSVVCAVADAPHDAQIEPGWRALRVAGPLDFSLTGILASIAQPLAAAGIPMFALSTYDTDYVLVRDTAIAAAVDALRRAGHDIGP